MSPAPRRLTCGLVAAIAACGRIAFDPTRGSDAAAAGDAADAAGTACTPFTAVQPMPDVNSAANDGYPWVSSDGLELYFASYRAGGSGGSDLWVATRSDPMAAFGPPAVVAGVSSTSNERAPSLVADGTSLYFTAENRPGGVGSVDIWSATRPPSGTFGAPSPVPGVNTTAADRSPAISADGLVLCFGSDRAGGVGGYDLWCTSRAATTAMFDPPELLAELASPGSDWTPWLSPDLRTLMFSSNRPGGMGGMDLWISTRDDPAGAFDAPVNLVEVNTADDETTPVMSADLQTLYYRSTGAGGAGGEDVWTATRTCQ